MRSFTRVAFAPSANAAPDLVATLACGISVAVHGQRRPTLFTYPGTFEEAVARALDVSS